MKHYIPFLIFIFTLCFSNISAWSATQPSSTMPDFNYPKTVIANADKDLSSMLKAGTGNANKVIDALIRSSLAKSMISEDNFPDIISNLDKIIAAEKDPCILSILRYLEAEIYNQYLDRYEYEINDRKNLATELPADVTLWDKSQFKAKIASLVAASLSESPQLQAKSITDYHQIIKINDNALATYPTLYDFMAYRAIQMYQNIGASHSISPYWRIITSGKADKYQKEISDIYDSLLRFHADGSIPYIHALVQRLNYFNEGASTIDSLYTRYQDNPNCAPILLAKIEASERNNDAAVRKANYALVKSYISRFPNAPFTPSLQNKLYQFEEKHIELNFREQYSSRDSISISCHVQNVGKFTLYAFRDNSPLTTDNIDSSSKNILSESPVYQQDISVSGIIPFSTDVKVAIPPLPYGKYVIVAAFDDGSGKSLIQRVYSRLEPLIVSDIVSFKTVEPSLHRVFAVNAITGAPVSNAQLFRLHTKTVPSLIGKTDASGSFPVTDKANNSYLNICNKSDKFYCTGSRYYYNSFDNIDLSRVDTRASIFTDLAIYRPGETVHFSAVCYKSGYRDISVIPNAKFLVSFEDSNDDSIAEVTLTSDAQGRITHDFVVPTNRMNGDFDISVCTKGKDKNYLGSRRIVVSEYKTPTFYIDWVNTKKVYSPSGLITLTGKAMSFTEMPKVGISIRFDISLASWFSDFNSIISSDAVTDDKGFFTLTLNARELAAVEKSRYDLYQVTATGTDAAGDAQSASTTFTLGPSRHISWNGTHVFAASPSVKLPVVVTSYLDTDSRDFTCLYTILDTAKKPVASGEFSTASQLIDLSSIPSGSYTVDFTLKGDTAVTLLNQELTLYRKSDATTPVADVIWIPEKSVNCTPGGKCSFIIGASKPDTHIYYTITDHKSIIRQGWLTLKAGFSDFSVSMPSDQLSNYNIQFYAVRDVKPMSIQVSVNAVHHRPLAQLTLESFRDHITAGSLEHWTLHFTADKRPAAGAALLCEMYDKAVNLLSDNTWSFSPELLRVYPQNSLFFDDISSQAFSQAWIHPFCRALVVAEPELNLYNQAFFSSRLRIRGRKMMANARVMESLAVEDAATMVEMKTETIGTALKEAEPGISPKAAPKPKQEPKVAMRTSQVKTALWRPSLVTDAEGNATIEFTTPNFNTTWLFQAMCYTPGLATDALRTEIISSKPIMVKPNMPRFLRQADQATLIGTVENASDSTQSCKVSIEVFNPVNNQVIASQSSTLVLASKQSQAVAISCSVPDTLALLGYRLKAHNGSFGDGEQDIIPILSDISPVVEATPFYINPGTPDFSLRLPDFPRGARVTFEYCDNPLWYAVTALPTIFTDNYVTASSIAHSLFAVSVAQHIAASSPVIRDAVNYWTAHPQDSTLVSALSRNSDLKIGTLLASPWLNDAQRQTLRMSRIAELFDSAKMAVTTADLIAKLQALQLPDGGWTWYRYPGCESAPYTTLEVLGLLGEMKQLQALPADKSLAKMIDAGIAYLDKELVRILNLRRNKLDFTGLADFAYTRSLFRDHPMSATVGIFYDKIIHSLATEWKSMNTADKAYAAITLANFDKLPAAASIVESLRQFSITRPASGMYWDNLQVGWYHYYNKVTLTSLILEAFHRVEPNSPDIDQIRKWILLDKQTNDWGSGSLAADAVYSLLSTGSKWLQVNTPPSFSLGSQPFELGSVQKYLGYGRRTLDVTAATGSTITITRDATNPAWGAVYSQYSAPMKAIQAASVPELSIVKEFITYTAGKSVKPASAFIKGEKVQVRLVIKTSRNLEYVTLTDERPACFEPADQISQYRYSDGLGHYLETKDSKTNVFIHYLPKGTHIITYDVYVTNPGQFSSGIATIQCQYAPQFVAHSAGTLISIAK